MYKNCASRSKTILDKFGSGWEVLKQILIFNIVDFDHHMLVPFKQLLL